MLLPLRRTLFSLIAAVAVVGCLSPTLPLPPPAEPNVAGPNEQGLVHLSGRVQPTAWVYAINRATAAGAFEHTGSDGRYDLDVAAQVGDELEVWYELDTERSEALVVRVEP